MTDAEIIAEAKQNRAFRFCPPDPIWAPSSALARARKALSDFDWRVGVWWSPNRHAWDYKNDREAEKPGRWRIMEWFPSKGVWETAFYWEGPNGEFRDIEPVQPIIDRLGRAMVSTKEAAQKAEESEQEREVERRTELAEANREFQADHAERFHGVRQTFGPGYIRRRRVKKSDLVNTNHQKFVRDHIKKYDGSP